jgi:hypothetical protein
LLYKDNWRCSKGTMDEAAIAIAGWIIRDTTYALMIATGVRTYPHNYANAGL